MSFIQHNPPHPGEFIKDVYLDPFDVSAYSISKELKVNPSTFSRLISGKSDVSSEMAVKLEAVLGRSAESWMAMQYNYDLVHARETVDVRELSQFAFG